MRNKYRARRVSIDGYSFASQLEGAVYCLLKNRVLAGEISDLKCQVKVYLTRSRILYKPDFSFIDVKTGLLHFAEAKGVRTAVWAIKKRLWKDYGQGPLEIWVGSYKAPKLDETVVPIDHGPGDNCLQTAKSAK